MDHATETGRTAPGMIDHLIVDYEKNAKLQAMMEVLDRRWQAEKILARRTLGPVIELPEP